MAIHRTTSAALLKGGQGRLDRALLLLFFNDLLGGGILKLGDEVVPYVKDGSYHCKVVKRFTLEHILKMSLVDFAEQHLGEIGTELHQWINRNPAVAATVEEFLQNTPKEAFKLLQFGPGMWQELMHILLRVGIEPTQYPIGKIPAKDTRKLSDRLEKARDAASRDISEFQTYK